MSVYAVCSMDLKKYKRLYLDDDAHAIWLSKTEFRLSYERETAVDQWLSFFIKIKA